MGLELAIAGIAASAIGTGVSVYGQMQAAKQSQSIANYNAMMQEENGMLQQQAANAQAAMMMSQATVAKRQAEFNNALSNQEAQAQFNNATSLQSQAEASAAVSRENIKRSQLQQQQYLGLQRAKLAASGVVESGSGLDDLVDTVKAGQQKIMADLYEGEINRRELYGKSALEEFSGKLEQAGAGAQLQAGLAQSGLMKVQGELEGLKGANEYNMQMQQANLTRMQGSYDAAGHSLSAFGGIFSGLANIGQQWTSWQRAYGSPASIGATSSMSLY
jgi:hypothetical protein